LTTVEPAPAIEYDPTSDADLSEAAAPRQQLRRLAISWLLDCLEAMRGLIIETSRLLSVLRIPITIPGNYRSGC
jgi:hypothetical protein